MKKRCEWSDSHPLYIDYHDTEWGTPLYNDRKLFEYLALDAMQAGLSWLTVLKKRDNFRKAFDEYDTKKIARYKKAKIEKLLQDEGIIRNRLKIKAAIANAGLFMDIQKEFGSFSEYIWKFVGGKTICNARKNLDELPAKTEESVEMSKELKKRGFKFVGPTICYAFM